MILKYEQKTSFCMAKVYRTPLHLYFLVVVIGSLSKQCLEDIEEAV